MNKSRLLGAVCAVSLSLVTMLSHAALVGVLPATPGGTDWQVVYDDDYGTSGITWVSNANLALTNQFGLTLGTNEFEPAANTVGSTGRMTWDNANAWIAGMNAFDGGHGCLDSNDWRLTDSHSPTANLTHRHMDKTKKYDGIDKDPHGAMNPTGNIIRDAWVFGIIPETETCSGWTIQGIDSLYDKVAAAWEPYGNLASNLPDELMERHQRIYDEAITRARKLGWNPELGNED